MEDVREATERYEAERLVPGARLNIVNDSSEYIIDIIDKLQSNAVFGIVFVTLALWLFIGWRAALAVVVGMPVTFAVTFIFMRATGRSLDANALFALVLVLGMIVDHAIVIAENCVRHIQMGKPKAQAVVDGAGEVFQPVLAATLTTIAAFLPLMLMPGIMGAFMRIIPLVVTLALVASNFEAFLILPAHVMDWTKPRAKGARAESRWFRMIRIKYLRALRRVIHRRYLAVALFLLIAVGSAFLAPLVGVEMFEGDPLSRFYVRVWMPLGTSLETTDELLSEIEEIAMELPDTDVSAVVSTAGMLLDDTGTRVGDRYGEVLVDMPDGSKESRPIPEIIADMRLRCSRLTGYETIRFTMDEGGPPTGKPVEVKVKGPRSGSAAGAGGGAEDRAGVHAGRVRHRGRFFARQGGAAHQGERRAGADAWAGRGADRHVCAHRRQRNDRDRHPRRQRRCGCDRESEGRRGVASGTHQEPAHCGAWGRLDSAARNGVF